MIKNFVNTLFFNFEREESELSSLFHRYYIENQDFIRKVVYWNIRETDQVDDLVQQTFLKAWRSFHRFEKKSTFKTWIYRICINVIHDNYSQRKVLLNSDDETFYTAEIELKDILDKSILVLKKEERELFILYFKFDYTFLEISEFVGVPVSTVKSKIYKAKEKFTKEYNKLGGKNGR